MNLIRKHQMSSQKLASKGVTQRFRAGAGPVLAALVLALVSACAAEPGTEPTTGSIPSELVGSWCGGSNSAQGGHYTWTFQPDGAFEAFNSDSRFAGKAVLDGASTLTIHVDDGQASSLSVGMNEDPILGQVLFLDGYSYLPGTC